MDKRILLEALLTEREGMIAENQHRLDCGQSIAYGDEAFQNLADQIRALASITPVQGDAECRCPPELCGHVDTLRGRFCTCCGKNRTP